MKTIDTSQHGTTFPARWRVAVPLSVVALLGLGCGGGGEAPSQVPANDAGPADAGPAAFPVDPNEHLTELPPVDPSLGFQIDEGTFTVAPGEEVQYCVRIPIPAAFRDRDLALVGWDWDIPLYSHHYFIAYSNDPIDGDQIQPCDANGPIYPVSGLTVPGGNAKLLFGAGVGVGRYVGRVDYGRLMRAGGHFVTNHHVLNSSPDPVQMTARFNLYVLDAAQVPHLTNELNCLTMDVSVPAASSREVTATCTAPFDLDITLLASHGHNHMTKFETRFFDGQVTQPEVLYESTDWDSPLLAWQDEPVHLKQGQGLTFTCYYENPGTQPIAFGTGTSNEMCATMNGYAFPKDRAYEYPPSLGALIQTNSPLTCLRKENGVLKSSPDCSLIDTEANDVQIPFF